MDEAKLTKEELLAQAKKPAEDATDQTTASAE